MPAIRITGNPGVGPDPGSAGPSVGPIPGMNAQQAFALESSAAGRTPLNDPIMTAHAASNSNNAAAGAGRGSVGGPASLSGAVAGTPNFSGMISAANAVERAFGRVATAAEAVERALNSLAATGRASGSAATTAATVGGAADTSPVTGPRRRTRRQGVAPTSDDSLADHAATIEVHAAGAAGGGRSLVPFMGAMMGVGGAAAAGMATHASQVSMRATAGAGSGMAPPPLPLGVRPFGTGGPPLGWGGGAPPGAGGFGSGGRGGWGGSGNPYGFGGNWFGMGPGFTPGGGGPPGGGGQFAGGNPPPGWPPGPPPPGWPPSPPSGGPPGAGGGGGGGGGPIIPAFITRGTAAAAAVYGAISLPHLVGSFAGRLQSGAAMYTGMTRDAMALGIAGGYSGNSLVDQINRVDPGSRDSHSSLLAGTGVSAPEALAALRDFSIVPHGVLNTSRNLGRYRSRWETADMRGSTEAGELTGLLASLPGQTGLSQLPPGMAAASASTMAGFNAIGAERLGVSSGVTTYLGQLAPLLKQLVDQGKDSTQFLRSIDASAALTARSGGGAVNPIANAEFLMRYAGTPGGGGGGTGLSVQAQMQARTDLYGQDSLQTFNMASTAMRVGTPGGLESFINTNMKTPPPGFKSTYESMAAQPGWKAIEQALYGARKAGNQAMAGKYLKDLIAGQPLLQEAANVNTQIMQGVEGNPANAYLAPAYRAGQAGVENTVTSEAGRIARETPAPNGVLPLAPGQRPDLVGVTSRSGARLQVDRAAASQFQGLITDLEAAGYKIDPKTSSGYANRNIANTNTPSQHAFGMAVDLNSQTNARGTQGEMDPVLANKLAEKYGLTWGGNWRGATRDPMHFEVPAGASNVYDVSKEADYRRQLGNMGMKSDMVEATIIAARRHQEDPIELGRIAYTESRFGTGRGPGPGGEGAYGVMPSQNPWQVAASSGHPRPANMMESADEAADIQHRNRIAPGGTNEAQRLQAYRGGPTTARWQRDFNIAGMAAGLPAGQMHQEDSVNAARLTGAVNMFYVLKGFTAVDDATQSVMRALMDFSSSLKGAVDSSAASGGPSYGLTPN